MKQGYLGLAIQYERARKRSPLSELAQDRPGVCRLAEAIRWMKTPAKKPVIASRQRSAAI